MMRVLFLDIDQLIFLDKKYLEKVNWKVIQCGELDDWKRNKLILQQKMHGLVLLLLKS